MAISNKHRSTWQKLRLPVRSALFFTLFFFFVWLWVNPELIYHRRGRYMFHPVHVPGTSSFMDIPAYPGEAAEYLSARLSHYNYYSWAGALIITVIAWLLYLVTDKFITAMGGGRLRPLRFIPAVLLLMQYGRYYHYPADSLSLLTGLLLLYLYIRTPLRGAAPRFVVFLVLSAVIYVAAVEAYPVFVLLCGIFEFFNERRWATGLSYVLSALLIPYVAGTFIFDMNITDAYHYMLPFAPEADGIVAVLKFSLFLFFSVAGLGCVFQRLFTPKRKSKKLLEYYRRTKLRWLLETLVLLIAAAGPVLLTCDRITRINLRIDYFARYKMWPELLREARKLPAQYYDLFVCHDVNRALYHTGRLAYEMFSYPQHYSGLLLTSEERLDGEVLVRKYIKSSDTLYEMGHVNKSEHFTYEALAALSYYPEGLQRLALINIVKGQTDAARTFLRALSKDFLYKNWAEQYLAQLEADLPLSTDAEVQRMRSLMLVKDDISGGTRAEDFFIPQLLLRNKHNRMAFEYLMAFFLLAGQYTSVVQNIGYLDNFDYPEGRIPRHYEEAILLYTRMTGKKADLYGRRINADTVRRFEELLRRSERYGRDPQAAAKALQKDYGDTYYYFYFFLLDKSELEE